LIFSRRSSFRSTSVDGLASSSHMALTLSIYYESGEAQLCSDSDSAHRPDFTNRRAPVRHLDLQPDQAGDPMR
jgi:hypothetical protein